MAPKGTNQHNDNVMIQAEQGNSRAYTLDRLDRERPDLAQRVERGEMSANAAAIEAGFRKKLTHFEQIKKWLPDLTDNERTELRALL